MSTLNSWWNSRAGMASTFLKTGNFVGFNQQSGSCIDSSYCAIGYACIGGQCVKKDSPSTGGDSPLSPEVPSGGSIIVSPNNCGGPGPQPPGQDPTTGSCASPSPDKPDRPGCTLATCGQDWGGGGYGPETDCCGTRTCRYAASSIQCWCGSSPSYDECNEWCDEYKKSTGEISPACKGQATCDECTYCNNGRCKEATGAPCHCANGSSCPDGLQCTEDGTCVEVDWMACCFHTEICACEQTVHTEACVHVGPGGLDALPPLCDNARARARAECKDICEGDGSNNEGTEGGCDGNKYYQGIKCFESGSCEDGFPCPENSTCRVTGCVKNEDSGELCYIYTQIDSSEANEFCCKAGCNCHSDCGAGFTCTGECEPIEG